MIPEEASHAALAGHPLPVVLIALAILSLAPRNPVPTRRAARLLERISHLIVISRDHWSFDGLFRKFPGANGVASAGATVPHAHRAGRPHATLPRSTEP